MFTEDNTDGFTAADLAAVNEALAIRMDRGEDEKGACDAINNAWREGATVEALIAVPKRIGRPPVTDRWTILRVSIRESDLARIKELTNGEPSPWARDILLSELKWLVSDVGARQVL